METLLLSLDAALASACSPFIRAWIWGVVTGALSMGIYVLIAPQDKLRAIKAVQKDNKKLLKAYDGEFDGLKALIAKDLSCSMRLVGLSLVPFVVSVAPAFGIMYGLETAYLDIPLPQMGAEWTGNFEFWYILSAILSSLATKIGFKIT